MYKLEYLHKLDQSVSCLYSNLDFLVEKGMQIWCGSYYKTNLETNYY